MPILGSSTQAVTLVNNVRGRAHIRESIRNAEPDGIPISVNKAEQNNLHKESIPNANGSSNLPLIDTPKDEKAHPTNGNSVLEGTTIIPNNNSNHSNPNSCKNKKTPTEIVSHAMADLTINDNMENVTQSFV